MTTRAFRVLVSKAGGAFPGLTGEVIARRLKDALPSSFNVDAAEINHVEPTYPGNRGFARFDPVPSEHGGGIQVYESSAASGPHIWAATTTPIDLNNPNGDKHEGTLHLTLENATVLRDQLTWLIENHYQVRPR